MKDEIGDYDQDNLKQKTKVKSNVGVNFFFCVVHKSYNSESMKGKYSILKGRGCVEGFL